MLIWEFGMFSSGNLVCFRLETWRMCIVASIVKIVSISIKCEINHTFLR